MKTLTEKVIRIAPESVDEMLDILEAADADLMNAEADCLRKYGFIDICQWGGMWLDRGNEQIFPISWGDRTKIGVGDDIIYVRNINEGRRKTRFSIDFEDGGVFFVFYPDRVE